jgi:polysaccharide chain length determinant protein (PEP-CTERM system associated)
LSPVVSQILEEVRGVWRFRWYAMAIVWVVCIGGWIYVIRTPDVFQAKARVYVDTSTAVRKLVQGLVTDQGVEQQLNLVRQAMLGRPALEKVARETDLDLRASTPAAMEELLEGLANRITVDIQSGGRNATDSVYTISYRDANRKKSIQVVDTILKNFVEDTLGGKRSGSEVAQKFVVEQIRDYERRLSAAEERLAQFKKQNLGLMPGESGDYFERLQRQSDLVRTQRDQLSIASSRLDELKRQLRGEQAYVAPVGGGVNPTGTDTAGRLQDARARLDNLLLSFTDRHPDVVALRDTIRQLEERQRAELQALQSGDRSSASSSGLSANPVHQQIQLQANQTQVEIAALQRQINDGESRANELRRLLDTAPEVEAEFARLNRDYGVTKAQYTALVDRLEKSRLSEQAEESGAVRFEVIDPPNASFEPVAPNRPRLLMLVLVAGFATGGGVAYLLHMFKPVFNNVRTLGDRTGLVVLGAVSMTWMDKQYKNLARGYVAYAAAAAALIMVFAVVFVFQQQSVRVLQRLLG